MNKHSIVNQFTLYKMKQCNIGALYGNGHGVTQDYDQAMQWYQKAADLGESLAMNNIAWFYDKGRGLKEDAQEAARWMESALRVGSESSRKQMKENQGAWSSSFRIAFQKHLKDSGVYYGNLYGIFGPETHKAIDAIFRE